MEIVQKIFEMNKRLIIGLIALAVAFALSLSSQGANATTAATSAAPANQPYVVTGEQIDVSGIRYRGTILEDVKMHQGTKPKMCRWVNGGYNSGRSVNGELQWHHDPVRAKICRNPNSPTNWVKVAGGQTGRNCGNPFKPHGQPPGPVVKGPVVMVRNFHNVNMNARAKASVNLSAEVVCPDGAVLSAQSSGEATSSVRINKRTLMRAQGNTDNIEARLRENVRAQALAKAEGNVNVTCGVSVAPAVEFKEVPKPPEPEPKKEVVIVREEPKKEKIKPVQPEGKVQPTKLPETGPGAMVAAFIGVSSLASFAYSAVSRRLGL
jgi:hypothetical protein